MKRIVSLLSVLVLIFGLVACGGATVKLDLGTSNLYVIAPQGYVDAYDEFDEDQVNYYYKDDESIDFDVYQWEKGEDYTLESEAEYFAAQYGTTATAETINGLSAMKYVTTEEYEGEEYTVYNYMFDDGEYIVEICFWTIGTAEEIAAVEEIINTIALY